MAIILSPTTPNTETRSYFATKAQSTAVRRLVITPPGCFCMPLNCDIPMPQFINRLNKTNTYENDFHSFIFELPPDTFMVCTITNLDNDTEFTITNDDFGSYFNVGDFTARPLVWALIVDWNKVFDQFGVYGKYRFNFQVRNIAPVTIFEQDSMCFDLKPWDCEDAHGTVRIETTQNGHIFDGFDYQDIIPPEARGGGWRQQIRWYGRLTEDTPETQVDYIDSTNYEKNQIQQLIVRKYNLRLDMIGIDLTKPILNDYFMANKILFTDYNADSHEDLRNKRVILEEIGDFDYTPRQKRIVSFNSKFAEYKQGKIKRNF